MTVITMDTFIILEIKTQKNLKQSDIIPCYVGSEKQYAFEQMKAKKASNV